MNSIVLSKLQIPADWANCIAYSGLGIVPYMIALVIHITWINSDPARFASIVMLGIASVIEGCRYVKEHPSVEECVGKIVALSAFPLTWWLLID